MQQTVWRQAPVANVVMGGVFRGFRWHEPFTSWMTLPYTVMYHNTRGQATIEIAGESPRNIELGPGETLCVAAGQRVRRTTHSAMDHAWLHLQLAPTWQWTGAVWQRDADVTMGELWQAWVAGCDHQSASHLAAGHGLAALAVQALGVTPVAARDPAIATAINAWQAAGWPPIEASDLADQLDCHPKHAARRFRQAVGVPLARYLRQQRIEAACQDLLDPALDIDTVASRYGFCDRYHFSRCFTAHIGQPPVAWRRAHGGRGRPHADSRAR